MEGGGPSNQMSPPKNRAWSRKIGYLGGGGGGWVLVGAFAAAAGGFEWDPGGEAEACEVTAGEEVGGGPPILIEGGSEAARTMSTAIWSN